MGTYHLRRYFLASDAATIAYLAIWEAHVTSLADLGIATEGFFTVAESPLQVVALLRFPDGMDPEAAIHGYMASPGFARDMAGFDMAQIEQVEVQTLSPARGSPLA